MALIWGLSSGRMKQKVEKKRIQRKILKQYKNS